MPLSVLFAGLLGLALPQSEPAPIPIELALGARRLALADRPTSSPDGKHVAYVVKDMTAANPGARQARYAPTGIPGLGEGCRLYLTETATGKTAEIGPAKGSSIRPSWSPAGDAVAFYSDAGGKAQLWIYSVKDGKARRAGDARVRAHLWPGDEPAFARDGKSVIVGLYPERLDVRSSGPEGAEPRRGPEVHASGGDEAEAPADGGALERHFDRENAIDVASIDLESGAARVLVSSLVKPAPAVARLSPTGRFVSYLTVFRAKSEASVEAAFDLVVLDAAAKKEVFKAEALDVDERDTFGLAYRWHPREDRLYFVKDKRVWEADLTGASGLTQAKVEPRVLA
jgi:Tol biopolymer transport system component